MKIKSIQEMPPKYKGKPRSTIAVAGKSNVGKSSLINVILGRKIAATSKSPGRTRKVVRYLINERFDLVDLPGYGFAKVGEELRKKWRAQVTDFLSGHGNLQCLMVLVDIRRGLGDLDREMLDWANLEKVRAAIILTKADKLPQGQQAKVENKIKSELSPSIPIYKTSTLKKLGIKEVSDAMESWWSEGE